MDNYNYKDAKILIVDDQKHNRDLVKFFLQQSGFENFLEADCASAAIEMAQRYSPDLIFLDIQLGDESGFDVCKKLKESPKSKDIPVLFLSSFNETENKVIGYKLGAVDFVNKPINHYEIMARTQVHLRNGQLLKELQSYQSRTSKELERAKQTQSAILPSKDMIKVIEQQNSLKIDSVFKSSSELAGDYWKTKQVDDRHVLFMLADFSGHGVYSALNTMRLDLLVSQADRDTLIDPRKAIKFFNEKLHEILPSEDFCSMVYIVINSKTGFFEYVGAGSPDIYMLRKNQEIPTALKASGVPLAFSKKIKNKEFSAGRGELKEGDSIFVYSDALIEEKHKNGKRWLDEGLIKVLKDAQKITLGSKFDYILGEFESSVNKPLKDDLTMVYITKKRSIQQKR